MAGLRTTLVWSLSATSRCNFSLSPLFDSSEDSFFKPSGSVKMGFFRTVESIVYLQVLLVGRPEPLGRLVFLARLRVPPQQRPRSADKPAVQVYRLKHLDRQRLVFNPLLPSLYPPPAVAEIPDIHLGYPVDRRNILIRQPTIGKTDRINLCIRQLRLSPTLPFYRLLSLSVRHSQDHMPPNLLP